jgi:hypothetical protein
VLAGHFICTAIALVLSSPSTRPTGSHHLLTPSFVFFVHFAKARQVATIKLIHVPGHSGIWQNDTVDKLTKQAL